MMGIKEMFFSQRLQFRTTPSRVQKKRCRIEGGFEVDELLWLSLDCQGV